MKRLLLFILLLMLTLALFACVTPPDTPPEEEYPEGAIVLNEENFSTYFEIKVKTELEEDYITSQGEVHKQTKATTYVAIVPKGDYTVAEGIVTLSIDSAIGRSAAQSYPDFRIVTLDQQFNLNADIVNRDFHLTAQADRDYAVLKDSDKASVKTVKGYLIEGAREHTTELDRLTAPDRDASDAIKEELLAAIEAYKNAFATVDSYSLKSRGVYILKSLYGTGRDRTNGANYGKNPYLIDLENHRYVRTVNSYLLRDGVFYEQYKNSYGLIEESVSGYTEEQIVTEATPDLSDLIDAGAIFVRGESEGIYYAYTTLSAAQNAGIRTSLKDTLNNYGCSTKHDKFVLKYTYAFVGDDFTFDATVTYQDARYHVEYVDIRVSLGFDLYDVGVTEVPVYTAGVDDFALEEEYEDAKKYLSGLVTVTPNTERVYYTLFQDSATNPGANEENYLPIRITESGLYEFRDQKGNRLTLYAMDSRREVSDYYEAGLYYIRFTSVPYGATRQVMTVSVTVLNDYADMENPISQDGNVLHVDLESTKDKQAFSFIPTESGIYTFSSTDAAIQFCLYLKDQTSDYIAACYKPYLSLQMEAGTEYIITAEIRMINVGEDYSLKQDFTLSYLGNPMRTPPVLNGEYQDIFLGFKSRSLALLITEAGYYTVDFVYQSGVEDAYAYFADADGYSDKRAQKITLPDGRAAYYLTPGEYLYTFSSISQYYLKGQARLVTEALATVEEKTVELSYDAYTSLSAQLPTIGSKVTFTFTVPEGANLLCPSDGFITLLDAEGNRVNYQTRSYADIFHGYESCYRWIGLSGGTYAIVVENTDVSGAPRTVSYLLRLQAQDEHEMQYYYMQAYPNTKREDIHIVAYLGMYWGYRVALIEVDGTGYADVAWTETVGGYDFRYTNANRLTVIKDGKAMTLSEMLENWPEDAASYKDGAIAYFFDAYKRAFPHLYE